ncbi:hypothetical protein NBO_64g0032 [Nosema bombycis CQ1]|uniref:ATP-dependent (S)-NAD(P)H-hydrate dehydratase n=1 Tax=Nosema bombycis (strain CQ1 / CVCC 102059) TaxID=578461 RepID=R0KSA4_NOSB1|nr:hypothetical protein NBO_64g0032 [Nosema bombycis CQ1]|eukprot:EOB13651.1 hypothetical protein NBO_64g0032 [Nosema bombycis CQ1]
MNLINEKFEFENDKKGKNGTVLIIGGSAMYTGAPYFSGLSALRTGADLVYIFTDNNAVIPLKVLLPEAIVTELSYEEWILERVDICIFGTGLGRPSQSQKCVIKSILQFLHQKNKKIIIDGDGIKLSNELDMFDFKNIIFTPNQKENKHVPPLKSNQYLIKKGEHDVIQSKDKTINVKEETCDKRVGGQGDILVGILATLLIKVKDKESEENIFLCLKIAVVILRTAGKKAFDSKGRSLITRDILDALSECLKDLNF